MRNKSLFILSSPFQALCAIEAINEYNIINPTVVILQNTQNQTNNGIEKILNNFSIDFEIISVNSLFFILKKGILKQFNEKLYQKKFDLIFLGDYFAYNIRLFSWFFFTKNTKFIILDDGSSTLILFKKGLYKPKVLNLKNVLKQTFVETLFLFRKKNISFFSIFATIEVNLNIKHNKLISLQKKNMNQKPSGVYIVGTTLTEYNLLLEKDYLLLIKKIVTNYSTEKLYYCPHRIEDKKKVRKINDKLNLKQFNTEYILEYDFFKKNIYPKIIIGFGSTALYSLKTLYPKALVYTIKFTSSDKKIDIIYEDIYKSFILHGIKVIK